jgi:hypothetical protein
MNHDFAVGRLSGLDPLLPRCKLKAKDHPTALSERREMDDVDCPGCPWRAIGA